MDRPLGRKIVPRALRDAGEQTLIHDELFLPYAKDEVWLAEAVRNGWVVLTADKHFRYRTNAIQALRAAKVRAFVLSQPMI
jgi:hypothetical protein